jgi:hypothetical protein
VVRAARDTRTHDIPRFRMHGLSDITDIGRGRQDQHITDGKLL